MADRDASEPGFAARYEFQYEQDRQRYQKSRDYWLRADERLGKVKQDGFTIQGLRSEEHTSELQSLMRISYAVFCLKKKKQHKDDITNEYRPHNKRNIR